MNFKVGDEIVCDCGDIACTPFVITSISKYGDEYIIKGEEDGSVYIFLIDDQLRKVTKLEKALK